MEVPGVLVGTRMMEQTLHPQSKLCGTGSRLKPAGKQGWTGPPCKPQSCTKQHTKRGARGPKPWLKARQIWGCGSRAQEGALCLHTQPDPGGPP